MDINKVFLSGVISSIAPCTPTSTNFLELKFFLQTSNLIDGTNPETNYHQIHYTIYKNTLCHFDRRNLLNVGDSISIEGFLKNYIYVDGLGKSVVITRVIAKSIKKISCENPSQSIYKQEI